MLRITAVVLLLLAALPQAAVAQPGPKQTTYALIRCESPAGRESFCPADTRRGVQLVNNISGRCQLGRSWGYDATGIWVRGCSAEFEIGNRGTDSGWGWGYDEGNNLTCASENFRYTVCEASTRGGVRLVNQISRAECVEDRSWGYDRRGIWVDQGCAGEFALGGVNAGVAGGGRPPVGRPSGRDDGGYAQATGETFVCESRDGRRRYCAVELRGRSVAVVRNISREPCAEGSNYGIDNRGVWVDAGCRAEFRIIEESYGDGRRPGYPQGDGRRPDYQQGEGRRPDYQQEGATVRCESKDFRRVYCAIDDASRVELRKQISRARCTEGQTWGTDRGGLWVDQGCAAEFTTYR